MYKIQLMYNLLTREFISQHDAIATLITETVQAERIYLLGCSISHLRTESIFAYNRPTRRHVSHYYMLVLVSKNDNCSYNSMLDKIESRCNSYLPVTAIVLDAMQFNDWLQEGHSFAYKVYERAECIHDAGNVIFTAPKAIDENELNKKNETLYSQGINKTEEFLAGADLFRIREQNKMAAFMLHQAAEQALITFLQITTGLHLNTHSLDRLIRCGSMVSDKLALLFPRNNEKNERLFQLIQKAYIDTRYRDDYTISIDNLLILTERVRALEIIVKDTCVKLKEDTQSN
jgi:HEPN domain-containing protein